MAEPPCVLHAQSVTANYGSHRVIDSLDLDLRPGDFFSLLGANGSGKSTLLRALTGRIPLRGGRVLIGGVDLAADPEHAKRNFGYAVDAGDLLGARMKVSLAAALLGGPKLLILDESQNGLDPRSNWHIRRILTDLVRNLGYAVILSSHTTETIALTCTGAAPLDNGRIVHRWTTLDLAEGPAKFEARIMRALDEPIE
jgi:ABC-2 type transport system ATP-binding protein